MFKKIIIPVPKGYEAIKIEVPEEFVHLLNVKAFKQMPNGVGNNSTIILGEAKGLSE